MGDVMVLVDSEEEEVEEEEDAAEEEEEEASERHESPKEVTKYGHIHRVTALVNGNVDRMANGLQALQGKLFVIRSSLRGCGGLPRKKSLRVCLLKVGKDS